MGHIYSLDEFKFGSIPSKIDYDNAIRLLKSGLENLVNNKLLSGVTFVGSVTSTDFEIGSDIDLFVVIESIGGEDMLRELIIDITKKTHVFFDIKSVYRKSAEIGQHRLLYYYIHTIKMFSNRWVIGKDPVEIVAESTNWKNVKMELVNDMLSRIDSLLKSRVHTKIDFGPCHCSFLDRIVTLPIYAAIGVVRLRYGGQPTDKNGKRLSKFETCKLYRNIVPEKQARMVLKILNYKNEYRHCLKKLNGDIDEYLK